MVFGVMLKRIRTDQVRLGMFIHRLEGNWFRHPFWKARFVLDDPQRLRALCDSAVEWVLIDAAKGADVAPQAAAESPPSDPSCAPLRPAIAAPAGRHAAALSPEIVRAERLARAAGKAINRLFLEARLGRQFAARDVAPVVDEIYASVQRNIYAFGGLLRCQSDQVHLYRHALTVSALMVALARRMGLTPDETRAAGMVGLLMDTALAQVAADAGVADYRNLPDDLAQGHVLLAMTQLRAAGEIPDAVLTGCLQHHERRDGSGYPHGLAGDAIGQLAQMAAVCDDFDQLVAGGHQGVPVDPAHALTAIRAMAGIHDPALVDRLVEAVGVYPIGSFVQLRSGRVAMVVDQDPGDDALPVVRIFGSVQHGRLAPLRPVTLALGQCFGEDAITGIADPQTLQVPPFADLRADIMAGAIRASIR
jgi:HD-GYP domain-containing protein (c-di-GMP phosphodiesterase class II)